jgi:hypothetical protein
MRKKYLFENSFGIVLRWSQSPVFFNRNMINGWGGGVARHVQNPKKPGKKSGEKGGSRENIEEI